MPELDLTNPDVTAELRDIARFWVDDLIAAAFRGGLLGFSAVMGFIDRYLVDGVLNVVSVLTVETGDRLRRVQTGRVHCGW